MKTKPCPACQQGWLPYYVHADGEHKGKCATCKGAKRVVNREKPKRKRSVVIRGTLRYLPDGDFLEVSRTSTTVGMLSMGALLPAGMRRWKNKKVRITISAAK